jgi:hypothetical protein
MGVLRRTKTIILSPKVILVGLVTNYIFSHTNNILDHSKMDRINIAFILTWSYPHLIVPIPSHTQPGCTHIKAEP